MQTPPSPALIVFRLVLATDRSTESPKMLHNDVLGHLSDDPPDGQMILPNRLPGAYLGLLQMP